MFVKETLFYENLNNILSERIPNIKLSIDNYLQNYNNVHNINLEAFYSLEKFPYNHNRVEWRIEIDLGEFEYDINTERPFFIGGFISLEEISSRQMLFCNLGKIYNSFNPDIECKNDYQISFLDIDNPIIINSAIKNVNSFLDFFSESFFKEIDLIDIKKLK